MSLKTSKTSFARFLKDEKFIEWKLFPTDELVAYWENFQKTHPDEQADIALAEEHFRNIELSSYKATANKKAETLKKLEKSLTKYRHRRKIHVFTYAAAVCMTVVILSMLYYQIRRNPLSLNNASKAEYIVGNQLNSKDIQLITGNNTTSFQENIDIEIDADGLAQVKTTDKDNEEIAVNVSDVNTLIVPYGKRSTLTLADGSKVWLNSGSMLEFPTQFSADNREIRLKSGEMYIEVAPDKKKSFYVHTSDFNVKVYGTKFNISGYSGASHSVILVEGSISLQSAGNKEFFLSPNEQAVYSANGTFSTRKVDVTQFISWKDGYLEFNNTPMAEVLKQIERYYNLSFNYDRNTILKGQTCTGKIVLSDNLDNVMTTIALLSSTEYMKENNQIYIINKHD